MTDQERLLKFQELVNQSLQYYQTLNLKNDGAVVAIAWAMIKTLAVADRVNLEKEIKALEENMELNYQKKGRKFTMELNLSGDLLKQII